VPDDVLGQLGNRVQHALRAYTPRDAKAVKAAATTFRENPNVDTEKVITELGVGEALVSVLDPEGIPTMVQQTKIRPPESRMGPATPEERKTVFAQSPIKNVYDEAIDRESAAEKLSARASEATKQAETSQQQVNKDRKDEPRATKKRSRRETTTQTVVKSAAKVVTSRLGQQIIRGIMGSIFKGR
jgi:hypothetical protein